MDGTLAEAGFPRYSPISLARTVLGPDADVGDLQPRQTRRWEKTLRAEQQRRRNVDEPNKKVHASVGLLRDPNNTSS